ncbi:hypothetical protein HG531_003866 [Fusarium graminearum]|nr:hypothetical protein HG531_003866 [Fusarium graminearum]
MDMLGKKGRDLFLHRLVRDGLAQISTRGLCLGISNNLDTLQKASTPKISDTPVLLLKLLKTSAELLASFVGLLTNVVALDDLENLVADGCCERVVEMSGEPKETGLLTAALNFGCGADGS